MYEPTFTVEVSVGFCYVRGLKKQTVYQSLMTRLKKDVSPVYIFV